MKPRKPISFEDREVPEVADLIGFALIRLSDVISDPDASANQISDALKALLQVDKNEQIFNQRQRDRIQSEFRTPDAIRRELAIEKGEK